MRWCLNCFSPLQVRCAIGWVWLPPGADELAAAVDEAVNSALLQSAAPGSKSTAETLATAQAEAGAKDNGVGNALNSSIGSPSDEAINRVAAKLYLLTAKQAASSSSSSGSVAYRGWFLTLVEAPPRNPHVLDSGGEVDNTDDADEVAEDNNVDQVRSICFLAVFPSP